MLRVDSSELRFAGVHLNEAVRGCAPCLLSKLERLEAEHGRVVHLCAPEDEAVTTCCSRPRLSLPTWHRITLRWPLVTCGV